MSEKEYACMDCFQDNPSSVAEFGHPFSLNTCWICEETKEVVESYVIGMESS